jgi:hypothetical protein
MFHMRRSGSVERSASVPLWACSVDHFGGFAVVPMACLNAGQSPREIRGVSNGIDFANIY